MRGGFLVLLATLALSVAGCSRGGAPGSNSGPSTDPNLGDVVSESGLFAYQAPKGWAVQEDPEREYPVCVGPAAGNGKAPSIEANSQGYQSVDDFVKSTAANTGDVQIVDKGSFSTRSGESGKRIVARKGGTREVVIYAFSAKNGLLMTFTGSCAAADDGQVRPLFDASMKSLTLDKD